MMHRSLSWFQLESTWLDHEGYALLAGTGHCLSPPGHAHCISPKPQYVDRPQNAIVQNTPSRSDEAQFITEIINSCVTHIYVLRCVRRISSPSNYWSSNQLNLENVKWASPQENWPTCLFPILAYNEESWYFGITLTRFLGSNWYTCVCLVRV